MCHLCFHYLVNGEISAINSDVNRYNWVHLLISEITRKSDIEYYNTNQDIIRIPE